MIRDEHAKKTLDLVEADAIANEPRAYDARKIAEVNGEDWKKCEAYKNFRRESSLPFYCFFGDRNELVKAGHYSNETLQAKDENGKDAIQRFYKLYPHGSILCYDPSAPFGYTQYEVI